MPADPVLSFARSVTRGRRPRLANTWVVDACRRHLRDLELAKSRKSPWYWDRDASDRVFRFFRLGLRLYAGKWQGQPFVLLPWQCFVVGCLFGWKHRETGLRRFRTAYIETGKGSGKTPLCAGIGLYMLFADGEPAAEVYVAAYNADQAQVLFRAAVAMVRQSPEMSAMLYLPNSVNPANIAHIPSNSFFRPISAERQGRGKSGPIPHCALLDEVHEHPTGAMVEFMDAGKKMREQPLQVLITNSGSSRTSVCWEYHERALKAASGVVQDEQFFSFVCGMDKGDDPFKSERCWVKANPSMPSIPGVPYLRDQVTSARGIASKKYLVKRLNFCEWTDSVEGWLDPELWFPAQRELKLEAFKGFECYGGLDFSVSSDLTAFVLIFVGPLETLFAFSWFWMPGDVLLELEERDGMTPNYQKWRDEGHLLAPPGKVIDYAAVADHVLGVSQVFNPKWIAYDRAKIEIFRAELDKLGRELPLHPHPQGFFRTKDDPLWMPGSIEVTEAALKESRLVVAENPVLNWCVSSATVVASAINPPDRRFDKRKSTGRIDGAVALVEAVGISKYPPKGRQSVYNERGMRFL